MITIKYEVIILTKRSMNIYMSSLKYKYDLSRILSGPHIGAGKDLEPYANPMEIS